MATVACTAGLDTGTRKLAAEMLVTFTESAPGLCYLSSLSWFSWTHSSAWCSYFACAWMRSALVCVGLISFSTCWASRA